jgi:hypothetical protein
MAAVDTEEVTDEAVRLGREEGEAIWMFDALDTIKADAERTGGDFSVVEFVDFERYSVPLHAKDAGTRATFPSTAS